MAYPKLQFNDQCRLMDQLASVGLQMALSLLSVFWLSGCRRMPAGTKDVSVDVASTSVWQIAHVDPVTVADKMGCMSITASLAEQSIDAGQDAVARVEITVNPGYHVYGDVPELGPYSALKVHGSADDPAIVVLPSVLPDATGIADGKPVYRNSVTALIPLRVDTIRNCQSTLSIHVTVQACNDLACFPPDTIEVKLPLHIVQNAKLPKGE